MSPSSRNGTKKWQKSHSPTTSSFPWSDASKKLSFAAAVASRQYFFSHTDRIQILSLPAERRGGEPVQHGGQVLRIGGAVVPRLLGDFCRGGISLGRAQDRRRSASKRVHQSWGAGAGGHSVQLAQLADQLHEDCLWEGGHIPVSGIAQGYRLWKIGLTCWFCGQLVFLCGTDLSRCGHPYRLHQALRSE